MIDCNSKATWKSINYPQQSWKGANNQSTKDKDCRQSSQRHFFMEKKCRKIEILPVKNDCLFVWITRNEKLQAKWKWKTRKEIFISFEIKTSTFYYYGKVYFSLVFFFLHFVVVLCWLSRCSTQFSVSLPCLLALHLLLCFVVDYNGHSINGLSGLISA